MEATLFDHRTDEEILIEKINYDRHLRNDYDYMIRIMPVPTPRPRTRIMFTRKGVKCDPYALIYNPSEYTTYKEVVTMLLRDVKLGLKPGDYSCLFATFWLPYPASTPKKRLIDDEKHRSKPDWDNFIKGFQDALSDAGMLINGDGAISDGAIKKRYTTQAQGFITFNLV